MTRLTRRYRFCASHRLHASALSDDGNRELYGKCNNPHGHGHNYILEVAVGGPVNARTGQVLNVSTLDEMIQTRVLDFLDHKNLNRELPAFAGAVPTTENLTAEIRRMIAAAWPDAFPDSPATLAGLRLLETKNNFFEIRS